MKKREIEGSRLPAPDKRSMIITTVLWVATVAFWLFVCVLLILAADGQVTKFMEFIDALDWNGIYITFLVAISFVIIVTILFFHWLNKRNK